VKQLNQEVEEIRYKLMSNINRKIKRQNKVVKTVKKQSHIQDICNAFLINRFKAFVTDTFMIMMPLMYISFYVLLGSREDFAQHMALGWSYIMLPHFVVTILFWYFKAQTPGLRAYELAIVDSYTGDKPTIVSLINRYIFTTLSMVFILPMFVPYFNKKRKTLQDILSGTCITNRPNDTI